MGMDVYGRRPNSEAGKYFRANVWSWRPIHELCYELCSDLIDEETLNLMGSNDGAGPRTGKICKEMAVRFEKYLAGNPDEKFELECGDLRVSEDGHFVSENELAKNPDMVTHTPYQVDREHLAEWIEFLKHCNGFKVN